MYEIEIIFKNGTTWFGKQFDPELFEEAISLANRASDGGIQKITIVRVKEETEMPHIVEHKKMDWVSVGGSATYTLCSVCNQYHVLGSLCPKSTVECP